MPGHTRGPEVDCWLPYAMRVLVVAIEGLGRSLLRRGLATYLAVFLGLRRAGEAGWGGIGRTPAMAWLMDWRCGLVGVREPRHHLWTPYGGEVLA